MTKSKLPAPPYEPNTNDRHAILESLEHHGLAVLRGLVGPSDLMRLQEIVQALKKSKHPRSKQVLYTHTQPTPRPHFDTLMHQWLNPHKLEGRASTRPLLKSLDNLVSWLFEEPYVLFQDLVLLKKAGHKEFPWHQDFPFWPLDQPRGVVVWVPLVEIEAEAGGLIFAPGSHKQGQHPIIDLHTGEPQAKGMELPHWLNSCERVAPKFERGDIALFHPLTFHMSGAKRDGPERPAWSSVWMHPSVKWNHQQASSHPICQETQHGESLGVATVDDN